MSLDEGWWQQLCCLLFLPDFPWWWRDAPELYKLKLLHHIFQNIQEKIKVQEDMSKDCLCTTFLVFFYWESQSQNIPSHLSVQLSALIEPKPVTCEQPFNQNTKINSERKSEEYVFTLTGKTQVLRHSRWRHGSWQLLSQSWAPPLDPQP